MSGSGLKDWHEMLPLVRTIYSRSSVGCCWHIVLDDFNTGDSSVEFCANVAGTDDCETPDACRALVPLMRQASETQRMKAARA